MRILLSMVLLIGLILTTSAEETTTNNLLNQNFDSGNWSGTADGRHGSNIIAAEDGEYIKSNDISLKDDANLTEPQLQDGFTTNHSFKYWHWNDYDSTVTSKVTITGADGETTTQTRVYNSEGCGSINCGAFENGADTLSVSRNTQTDYDINVRYDFTDTSNTSGHWSVDLKEPSLTITYESEPIDQSIQDEINQIFEEFNIEEDINFEDVIEFIEFKEEPTFEMEEMEEPVMMEEFVEFFDELPMIEEMPEEEFDEPIMLEAPIMMMTTEPKEDRPPPMMMEIMEMFANDPEEDKPPMMMEMLEMFTEEEKEEEPPMEMVMEVEEEKEEAPMEMTSSMVEEEPSNTDQGSEPEPEMMEMVEEEEKEEEPPMEMAEVVEEEEKDEQPKEIKEEKSDSETTEATDAKEKNTPKQEKIQQAKTKTVRLEDILDKIDQEVKNIDKNLKLKNLIKLKVMVGSGDMLAEYNIPFYKPKDIYLDQIDMTDNRVIYEVDLVKYKQKDPIFIKQQKLNTILQQRQNLINEIEVLRNG